MEISSGDSDRENIILQTGVSIKTMVFGIVGTLFFGAFAYMMLSSKWEIEEGTNVIIGKILIWIFCVVFIFFTLGCLWTMLNVKTIYLTNKKLIIKRPFLFLEKVILLGNIKSINESPFQINPTVRRTQYNVYEGNQIVKELSLLLVHTFYF